MELTIDGIRVTARSEETILNLARENGIFIPTLCHHPALEPFGSCRLCTVEIVQAKKLKLDTACTHPAEEGMSVTTASTRVRHVRKMILSFLIARCPEVFVLKELADKMGLKILSLPGENMKDEKCILCGRCVRVCREAIGKQAISFAFRGEKRMPSSPFGIQSENCIGCTACEYVCPTGAVTVKKEQKTIYLSPWSTEVPLLECSNCGSSDSTVKAARHVEEKLNKQLQDSEVKAEETSSLCSKCRRKIAVQRLEKLPQPKVRGFEK